mgnify:CR=1 FL=1
MKIVDKAKKKYKTNKVVINFLLVTVLIGVIFGSILVLILNENDKKMVSKYNDDNRVLALVKLEKFDGINYNDNILVGIVLLVCCSIKENGKVVILYKLINSIHLLKHVLYVIGKKRISNFLIDLGNVQIVEQNMIEI